MPSSSAIEETPFTPLTSLAVLPLVYQIVANHAPREVKDDFPAELLTLGVLPPNLLLEKLQAQNAVKMARAQTEILAEKQAAEAELEELRQQAALWTGASWSSSM